MTLLPQVLLWELYQIYHHNKEVNNRRRICERGCVVSTPSLHCICSYQLMALQFLSSKWFLLGDLQVRKTIQEESLFVRLNDR